MKLFGKAEVMRKYKIVFFMVVVSLVAGRLSANQGGYFGDSTLYALSMQMYDSIRSSVFLELRQCGLQRAEATRNAHFDYVFRVALLSYYEVRKEKEEYRQACDRLVRYYQEMDEDSLLYETWGRLPDCLLKWGDYVEAVLSLREMSAYAQRHNHPMGMAISHFYFAQCYLNNGQLDEAERHYRCAMGCFADLDVPGKVARCGFNLISILLVRNDWAGALALSDSLPCHIRSWEQKKGIAVNPVLRVQQAMYRLKIFINMKDAKAAAVQRDSMLYYNKVYADASQQEELQYTLARYERLVGNYSEADRILKMLVDDSLQQNNHSRIARYCRTLAEVKRLENLSAEAAEYFHLYALAADSSRMTDSNLRLERITKLFRLNELEQEKRVVQAEHKKACVLVVCIAVVSVMVFLICLLLMVHFYRLRRKNRELVERIRSQEEAEERAMEACTFVETVLPKGGEVSREKQLFRQIQMLLADEKVLSRPRLGRDELAALLNTNRTYVAEAISTCTQGKSVSLFVAEMRVKRARRLLDQHTEMSLEEIGMACGFQSQSTFTKYYRNYYDITPGEYRKLVGSK